MVEPEKVDFSKVIAEIEAGGLSLYKIALMMHRQYTQVKRWREGKKEPLYYEGQMLLAIRAEVTPCNHLNDTNII